MLTGNLYVLEIPNSKQPKVGPAVVVSQRAWHSRLRLTIVGIESRHATMPQHKDVQTETGPQFAREH